MFGSAGRPDGYSEILGLNQPSRLQRSYLCRSAVHPRERNIYLDRLTPYRRAAGVGGPERSRPQAQPKPKVSRLGLGAGSWDVGTVSPGRRVRPSGEGQPGGLAIEVRRGRADSRIHDRGIRVHVVVAERVTELVDAQEAPLVAGAVVVAVQQHRRRGDVVRPSRYAARQTRSSAAAPGCRRTVRPRSARCGRCVRRPRPAGFHGAPGQSRRSCCWSGSPAPRSGG